jgi:DamX protein
MLVPDTENPDTTPFTVDSSADIFFHGGHWGQCLELITHLCQYSDSILLVTGPFGIGKTAMKQAMLSKCGDKFMFCEIEASANLEAEQLMQQIDTGFDVSLAKRGIINSRQVTQDLDLVLLIDNSEHLSINLITILFQLKQTFRIPALLHIVLFALPELEQKIQNSALKEDFAKKVHVIELEPLTLTETEAFLIHLWKVVGNEGEMRFNRASIKKIYSLSGGIPGKVKQLATSTIAGTEPGKVTSKRSRIAPFTVGLTVSFGVLFCLLAFLWPAADENLVKQQVALVDINSEKQDLSNDSIVGAPIPVPDLVPVSETAVARSAEPKTEHELEQEAKLAMLSAVESAADLEAQPEDEIQKIQRLENKILALQQQLEQEQQARRAIESKIQEVAYKPRQDQMPKKIASNTNEERHILEIPSKNYTLQLLGASNEQKVREFIRDNNLSNKARYFRSSYQGKPWFIVIYGNYTNRASANAALASLPVNLKKLQPWPREYVTIQRAIKKK